MWLGSTKWYTAPDQQQQLKSKSALVFPMYSCHTAKAIAHVPCEFHTGTLDGNDIHLTNALKPEAGIGTGPVLQVANIN